MRLFAYGNMGKISNITNSSDPQSINSRIFCGNLNTFLLTKDDVERIFKRYGRIIGISMHKGYAFVQYTNEYDARNSVAGEDQRIYASQPIDVNMAAEPKPNRPSRKRPQGAGSEWDYYYNAPLARVPMVPPLKRPRPDLTPMIAMNLKAPHVKRTLVPIGGSAAAAAAIAKARGMALRKMKGKGGMPGKFQPFPNFAETPDILICGNCKQMFPDMDRLSAHKRIKCKLRFLCKCNEETNKQNKDEPTVVSCATCHMEFSSCWDLCAHVQSEHGVAIFDEQKLQFGNLVENSSVDDGGNEDGTESTDDPSQEASSDMGVDDVTMIEGTPDGTTLHPEVGSTNGGEDVETAISATMLAQQVEINKETNNEDAKNTDEV